MPRDGTKTREQLMDAAEALILDHGFAGTSVDRIIEDAGVTKGTFFYHFDSKRELAHALVERYSRLDLEHLETNMARAEKLARDPLQQLLIFVGLFEEAAGGLVEPYPGCLFASYCYESQLFDREIHAVIEDNVAVWRRELGAKLAEVAERHPPRMEVDLESLCDTLTVVFEGAFILSKICKDPRVVAQQLRHYRNYLELLFSEG